MTANTGDMEKKTAGEILDQFIINRFDSVDRQTFVKAMKAYAKQALEEAAERAKVIQVERLSEDGTYTIVTYEVDKQSILSIQI